MFILRGKNVNKIMKYFFLFSIKSHTRMYIDFYLCMLLIYKPTVKRKNIWRNIASSYCKKVSRYQREVIRNQNWTTDNTIDNRKWTKTNSSNGLTKHWTERWRSSNTNYCNYVGDLVIKRGWLDWFDFWFLTPLSAIFQLYPGDQF